MSTFIEQAREALQEEVRNNRDVNRNVTLIDRLTTKKESTELKQKESIAAIKEKYGPEIKQLEEIIAALTKITCDYAMANQETVFANGTRTADYTSGKIQLRTGRPHLEPEEGQTWKEVLQYLIDNDETEYLRVKYEIDKAKLLSHSGEERVKELMRRIQVIVSTSLECIINVKH